MTKTGSSRTRLKKNTRSVRCLAVDEAGSLLATENVDTDHSFAIRAPRYEAHQLARARTQWEFGDWQSLSNIDCDALEHHPERAKITLLAAAGCLQLGDQLRAKKLLDELNTWGYDRRLVGRILTAGVYNSLGRAATMAGLHLDATKHFETSVSIGSPTGDLMLLKRARENLQVQQLHEECEVRSSATLPPRNRSPQSDASSLRAEVLFEDCGSLTCCFQTDLARKLSGREVKSTLVTSGANQRQLYYRPDSIGDIGVLKQMFGEKHYEFAWLPQGKAVSKLIAEMSENNEKPVIIDAGANIGASCIWFVDRHPGTMVLAIEPDLDNCDLLRNNCAGLPVHLFCGAVADSRRVLCFEDPNQSDWGFRVGTKGSRLVECVGPLDLLAHCEANGLTPVIFKIDIEGGESLLFSGDCKWIERIPVIIIELHDWLLPSESTSQNFIRAVSEYKLQVFSRGENIFCFNRNLLARWQ